MGGLLARGQAMLNRVMGANESVALTYSRGSLSATLTTAWVGRTLFAGQSQSSGARAEWGERDYLIPVASLALGGVLVTPSKNDRITEVIGGIPVVFELQTPTGEPCWRFSDQARTLYRVHCKRVA